MVSENDFASHFPTNFWKTIRKDTLIEYPTANSPIRDIVIPKLYEDIKRRRFHPSEPRNYIVSNKHNRVSRIVPSFDARENSAYYFCTLMLQTEIAINRVEGTYGGWTSGNHIRTREEQETSRLTTPISGIPFGTYSPYEWSKNWKEFQKRAFEWSQEREFKHFLKFDIANFYDSINLNLLEAKIRQVSPYQKGFYIDLLFHFLRHWNKPIEGYHPKCVGIPQDEVGDSSRLLANFYLQEYDEFMYRICDENNARYLRYADDQIIMSPDELTSQKILFLASKELHKISLNINSSKVHDYNKDEFSEYWAFDIFAQLDDPEDKNRINAGVELFFARDSTKFRRDSTLKRILSLGILKIDLSPRLRVLGEITDSSFLINQDFWTFKRIAESISLEDRQGLFESLDKIAKDVNFNSFLLNLKKFYQKYRSDHNLEDINKRIKDTSLLLIDH